MPAPRRSRLLRRRESGQILPLFVLLLPICGMLLGAVVDFGYAYWLRGKLQSSADAAALAGAQLLPNEAQALSIAREYSAGDGRRNQPPGITGVNVSVDFECTDARFCGGMRNAVTVREVGEVETIFLRFFGMETLEVSAEASACSPCGSKPMDVMIVADRSGSMCIDEGPPMRIQYPACPDMANLREGVKAFLSVMDPGYDKVGLALLPPMPGSDPCEMPSLPRYVGGRWTWPSGYDGRPLSSYIVAPLATDYKTGSTLNTASRLVSTLNCMEPGGGTAYSAALDAAQAELDARGRADARDVIIFMADGAANAAPDWAPADYKSQPCGSAIRRANAMRARGTTVYSIGYDVTSSASAADEKCARAGTDTAESPAYTPLQALTAIGNPGQFYNQPAPGSLNSIFLAIAADLAAGTSRLTSTP